MDAVIVSMWPLPFNWHWAEEWGIQTDLCLLPLHHVTQNAQKLLKGGKIRLMILQDFRSLRGQWGYDCAREAKVCSGGSSCSCGNYVPRWTVSSLPISWFLLSNFKVILLQCSTFFPTLALLLWKKTSSIFKVANNLRNIQRALNQILDSLHIILIYPTKKR